MKFIARKTSKVEQCSMSEAEEKDVVAVKLNCLSSASRLMSSQHFIHCLRCCWLKDMVLSTFNFSYKFTSSPEEHRKRFKGFVNFLNKVCRVFFLVKFLLKDSIAEEDMKNAKNLSKFPTPTGYSRRRLSSP